MVILTGSAWAQNVEFVQASDPPGMVDQRSFPALGDPVATVTAPSTSTGYRFCYWTINGVRSNDLVGRAANPVTFTATGPIAATAHYLPENQDSNGSGLSDAFKLEYFGTLDITPQSDPVGDGFTVGQKLNYGWNPATFNQIEVGGISRRRGNFMVAVPGYVGPRENLGGISRRRSATTTVILNSAFARLDVVSDPAGIISGSSQVVAKGSNLNLPIAPDSGYGYRFTGWLVNGARVDSPTQNQPIPLTVREDTTVVARYILESADTLGVGIPDWIEWFNFNEIGYTLESDPIGDGLPLGLKLFRGYPLAVPNELATGGISRRRSATTLVILNTSNYVRLGQISDPVGIVSVDTQVVVKGSTVPLTTAPESSYGYRFTGWLVNGARVDSPTQKQPILMTVNADTTVVARYILESADTLGVGIPDWIEWFNFNEIGFTLDSDPVGDGLTLGMKLFRGYPLAAYNVLDLGGVSRRRSVLLPVNFFRVGPPGAATGTAGQIGSVTATFNGSVSPNSLPTSAYFEFGLTTGYESGSPPELAGSGTNDVAYVRRIGGFAPSTTYHFRVVSTSKSGTTYGGDQTFTTQAPPSFPTLSGLTTGRGAYQMSFTSTPGSFFSLFGTTNVALPPDHWEFLDLLTDDPPGQFQFTDLSATTNAQRFYRVVAQ